MIVASTTPPRETRKRTADVVGWCDCQPARRRGFIEAPGGCGLAVTRLVRCERCGLVHVDPRPAPEEVRRFYEQVELWTRSVDAEGNPRSYVNELDMKRPQFVDLVRRIQKRKRAGLVLDVGSAAGLLELAMDRSRWSVVGIDRSPFIAEFGRQELKTHVLTGLFEEVDFPAGSFDVIVLKYTLEQVDAPLEVLRKARELLKADGWLVLADVINIDSFCARHFRGGYRLIHPTHFTYFSPATIRNMLMAAGFDVVQIEYPYFRTPYFTIASVATLGWRALRQSWGNVRGVEGPIIFSMPFYGNMMDVWAVPVYC